MAKTKKLIVQAKTPRLFILRRPREKGIHFGEFFRMIIRAMNARQARKLASEVCGAEGPTVWLDAESSVIAELKLEGELGLQIVAD